MKKKLSKYDTYDYLRSKRGELTYAQNGLGYQYDDYLTPVDQGLNVLKAAGTGYLGSNMFHNAYYNKQLPNDPAKAKKLANEQSLLSGALNATNAMFTQMGERRDREFELQRIRERQAKDYYRQPVDNYAYNEYTANAYNNTAYGNGGATHKRTFQTGGLPSTANPVLQDTFNPYEKPMTLAPVQKDYYDSTYAKTDNRLGMPATQDERDYYNVLGASDQLNKGLIEQPTGKIKSNVGRFREKKYGGATKRYWQDGGMTDESGMYDSTQFERPPVQEDNSYVQAANQVFDSTEPESQYQDELPMNEDGYDLSKFTPTLGSAPLVNSMTASTVQDTISRIGQKESGGRYDLVNTSGGKNAIYATGKYQFVPKYWHTQIAEFQGTQGKSMAETMEVFRKNPQTQDAFMQHVTNDIYLPEVKKLLPLARHYGLGQDALIKMLHYRGIADTRKRLETGDFSVSQRERSLYKNPDILSYIKS